MRRNSPRIWPASPGGLGHDYVQVADVTGFSAPTGFDRDVDLEATKVYSSPYATLVRYTVLK